MEGIIIIVAVIYIANYVLERIYPVDEEFTVEDSEDDLY